MEGLIISEKELKELEMWIGEQPYKTMNPLAQFIQGIKQKNEADHQKAIAEEKEKLKNLQDEFDQKQETLQAQYPQLSKV